METSLLVSDEISRKTPLTPVVREMPADLETPISVYLKLRGAGPSFLLESVTGGENVARYSFIGVRPRRAYVFQGEMVEIRDFRRGEVERVYLGNHQDPLDVLSSALHFCPFRNLPGLPRLAGGLVGYLSYEMMRYLSRAWV
jgi:anthranilate synthase component 1